MSTRYHTDSQSEEVLAATATVDVVSPPLAPTGRENGGDMRAPPTANAMPRGHLAVSRWTPTMLADEKRRLVDYLNATVLTHQGVPSSRAQPKSPFTAHIAQEAGVRRSQISPEDGALRGILNDFIKRYGLKPFEGACGPHFERSDRVHAKLKQHIDKLAEAGAVLPALNGVPNMAAIARGAGVSASTLTDKNHRNHELVMQNFQKMGGGTEDQKRSGPLVLAELLLEFESRKLRPGLEIFRKSLPQLRHAVKQAIGLCGAEAAAVVALGLTRDAAEKGDLRSRLQTCIGVAQQIEEDALIPLDLASAIRWLCRRANYQPDTLAAESGVGYKLHDWLRGRHAPDRFLSYGDIRSIEEKLAERTPCAPRTLWNLVRFRDCADGTIPKALWPIEVPDKPAIRMEVKLYLDDDILTHPADIRREKILAAYEIVRDKRKAHVDENHAANCQDPYRFLAVKWSAPLRQEFQDLLEFHTQMKDIDFNMKKGNHWVQGTRERNITYVERAFGSHLRLNPETASDELSLALFAVPRMMDAVTRFAKSRRAPVKFDLWPEPVKPYRDEDMQLFIFAKTMLTEHGFMRRHPEYYERLNPQARAALDAEFPDAAGDWNAICSACAKRYDDSIEEIARWLADKGPEISAPMARIYDVLDNDPIDFRNAFGRILAKRLARCEPGYRAWAYAVEKLVYHELVAQYPHRSRAIREATHAYDQSGTIYQRDGKWHWRVHWTSIKNGRKSGYFSDKPWYLGEVEDINGLYDALDEYTKKGGARDWILKGRPSSSFFVTSSDKPELDAKKLYKKVAGSSLVVLSQMDDDRWSGVRSFGAHAERKIVFNTVAEPVSSPTFHLSYDRACGKLMISRDVADNNYRFGTPEDYAAGAVKDFGHARNATVPTKK